MAKLNLIDSFLNIEPNNDSEKEVDRELLYPNQIFQLLDKKLIGQTDSKKILSNFAYTHQMKKNGIYIDNNTLLIGPSGSGKTYIVSEISKILDTPFVFFDASRTVKSGIVGNSIDDAIISLAGQMMNIGKENLEGIVFF